MATTAPNQGRALKPAPKGKAKVKAQKGARKGAAAPKQPFVSENTPAAAKKPTYGSGQSPVTDANSSGPLSQNDPFFNSNQTKQAPPPKQSSGASTGSSASQAADLASQIAAESATGTDPFKGTPYEGMSAFEIATKIVNDEIKQQAAAISAQMAQQASINSNQLSMLSQLGQQLQAGAGQFANNYANTLGQLQQSYGNFSKGYQDTLNQFNQQAQQSGAGGFTPGPNGLGQITQDGQNVLGTMLQTNPFTVLPAAYGRIAQMDANLLASQQNQGMTGYQQQLSDLYSGADSAIMQEFMQIQSLFDNANANAAASASAAAASSQAQYQWEYAQAQKQAQQFTAAQGILYTVDPNTLKVVPVYGSDGKPVTTLAGQKLGVTIQNDQNSAAYKLKSLQLQQERVNNQIAHDQAVIADQRVSLALRRQAQADLKHQRAISNALAAKRVQIEQQRANTAAAKAKAKNSPSSTSSPAYKLNTARASQFESAGKYAQSLIRKTAKKAGVDLGTPAYTRDQVRAKVWSVYHAKLLTIAKAMKAQGLIKDDPRAVMEYWVNEIVTQAYQ